MSDVYSLFEKEAADPQAFNKVREGDAKNLSSLIQRSVELDKQIKRIQRGSNIYINVHTSC